MWVAPKKLRNYSKLLTNSAKCCSCLWWTWQVMTYTFVVSLFFLFFNVNENIKQHRGCDYTHLSIGKIKSILWESIGSMKFTIKRIVYFIVLLKICPIHPLYQKKYIINTYTFFHTHTHTHTCTYQELIVHLSAHHCV